MPNCMPLILEETEGSFAGLQKQVIFEYIKKKCKRKRLLCLISYGKDVKGFISFNSDDMSGVFKDISKISYSLKRKFGCTLNFPFYRPEKYMKNGKKVICRPVYDLKGSLLICDEKGA